MPVSITSHFKLSETKFKSLGAFDSFLDEDSDLFLDPALLFITDIREFKDAREIIVRRFEELIDLLKATREPDDDSITWHTAVKKFCFRELPGINLGYSDGHTQGRGIGKGLSRSTLINVHELVHKGVQHPRLFELVPIFQEGIGCDLVSDMLARILEKQLTMYSLRVFRESGLDVSSGRLPKNPFRPNTPVYALPLSLLAELPLAESWWDISDVCARNAEARAAMSQIMGDAWSSHRVRKEHLRALFLQNPDLVKSILDDYINQQPTQYDFENDPRGEFKWVKPLQTTISQEPLALSLITNPSVADIHSCVSQICSHYKDLIEKKGSWELLWDDTKRLPRNERMAQRAFKMVAHSYCRANNLDISPESNGGRGPVDFKFSVGLNKVLVELKVSSNSKLVSGYKSQLPIYQDAEDTDRSILLVIDFGSNDSRVNKLIDEHTADKNSGMKVPDLIIVDASQKLTGSKA
jgi:hypothetical protein